jgi:uncharacterized protein DUF2877
VEQAVTLSATLTDPAVALPGSRLRARVEHAYRAALYVRDEGSGRRAIVAIEDVGGQPGGILIRGATDLRGIRATVIVDLSAAVTWSPRLPAAARIPSPDGPKVAGEVIGTPAAAVHISALRTALLADEVAAAEQASVALIGLGIGLTPSGDDFLVGLLAGLEATDDPMRDALAAVIAREAPGRTTEFGAALLEHACRGEFSQRLHDVLIAIAARDALGLAPAIQRATAYGATSGADTLAGLSCALDVAGARANARRIAA